MSSVVFPEGDKTAAVTTTERLRVRQRPRELPAMRQLWQHLAFIHWPVDVALLRPLIPPGLDVGLVPFNVIGTRPPFLPALPGFSDFHEVNVRTYVHRAGRAPGVWFFSLDASSRLTVAGARAVYKLPYFHSRIDMKVQNNTAAAADVLFASRRRAAGAAAAKNGGLSTTGCGLRYRPAGPPVAATPGSLEFFLAERYLLYAWDGRRLRSARVFHQPYPLQRAAVDLVDESLLAAAGLARPETAPLVHYASEVNVRIYRPRLVQPAPPSLGAPASPPELVSVPPSGAPAG
jgi:uncharacterized protein YqjF (DUF2071 family)